MEAKEIMHKKKYEFQTEKGSKVEIKIETKIENLCEANTEEILHEYAICTHNSYLSLANKLTGVI